MNLIDRIKLNIVTYTDGLVSLDDVTREIIRQVELDGWIRIEIPPEEDGYYLVYSPAYYGLKVMEFKDNEWWWDDTSPTSGNTHWKYVIPPESY